MPLKGFPGGSVVKNPAAVQETWVQSLSCEDPLGKEMAACSSIHACKVPQTEEPTGLQFIWSQRIRRDWVTDTKLAN